MAGPCPYSRSTLSTLDCRHARIANIPANTLPAGLSGMDFSRSGTDGVKQGQTIQIACDPAGCGCNFATSSSYQG